LIRYDSIETAGPTQDKGLDTARSACRDIKCRNCHAPPTAQASHLAFKQLRRLCVLSRIPRYLFFPQAAIISVVTPRYRGQRRGSAGTLKLVVRDLLVVFLEGINAAARLENDFLINASAWSSPDWLHLTFRQAAL